MRVGPPRLLFSTLVFASGPVFATIVATDKYDAGYSAGTQVEANDGTSINGGFGFTSQSIDDAFRANVTTSTQNLLYSSGELLIDGGPLALTLAGVGGVGANSNNLVSRSFDPQSGTVYFSFLLRTTNLSSEDDFIQLGLSDVTTAEPKISIGAAEATSGTPPMLFFVRVPTGTGNQAFTSSPQIKFEANTTYFLVGKASKTVAGGGYNQIDLFLNPSTLTEGTPTISKNVASATMTGVSNLIVRTARMESTDQYYVDDVTIGTTYADVVQVPEPTTPLLVVSAFVLLGLRRGPRRARL